MFHFWSGFVKVQIYDKKRDGDLDEEGGVISAFVLFDAPQHALMARDRLQDYIFDRSRNTSLRVNIAMKNLVLSRQEQDEFSRQSHPPAPQPPPPPSPYPDYYGMVREWSPYVAPPPLPGAFHPYHPPASRSPRSPADYDHGRRRDRDRSRDRTHHDRGDRSDGPDRSEGRPSHPQTPINTLFVSGLDGLSDEDLLNLLQTSAAGYKNHKRAQDRQGQQVAFIEFESISHAEQAIPILQGHSLQASFAKNPLNQRKR